MTHHLRKTCRGCGGASLERFLELGPQPLANALLESEAAFATEASYPLDVYFCRDCTLVQLLDVIDPEVLFGHYLYVTGTSSTMAAHNAGYAEAVIRDHRAGPSDRVVEVASNDGSLLAEFKRRGVRTLGIEPARNIAAMANERGIETINRFFDRDAAREIRAEIGPSRVAIGNNVLAHVDDTRGFLEGMRTLVEPDGVVIVEVPYAAELLDRLEYDTIYHEHLCYFSVTALMRLYAEAGLDLVRIDHMPVHGGSLRLHAVPARAGGKGHSDEVRALARREADAGLVSLERHRRFADDVAANRRDLLALLRSLKSEGKRIAAYGAPAKGNTLLNYCGIGTDLVEFTVDRNPLKVGRFTPGRHLPILETSAIAERRPDVLLILPWNLADEIMRQESAFAARGGRFIVPVPKPQVR